MKKNLLFLAIALLIISTQLSAQSVLIQYWNFNSFTLTGNAAADVVANPISPLTTDLSVAQANSGSLSYTVFGVNSPSTYMTFWDCNTPLSTDLTFPVNQRNGAVYGNGLRLRNPSDAMQLVMNIPSTGFKNLVISYDVQRSSSSNGALTNTFYYSIDNGTTWKNSTTNNGGLISKDTIQLESLGNWRVKTVSITDPSANDNPNLKFKILFTGGYNTTTKGNVRIDNITVEGVGVTTAINEPKFNNTVINMSPNSTSNGIVRFSEVVDAVVYNLQGRQIKAVAKTTDLITSNLAKGIYVVRINGLVSKKLIIE